METLQVIDNDIASVTEAVWTSVLGMQFERRLAVLPPPESAFHYSALVLITGTWSGAIVLRCGAATAARCASILIGDEASAAEDRREALADVASLIAGNIKSLLPGPSKRSIATIVEGDSHVFAPAAEIAAQLEFWSEGSPVRISIFQQND